MATSHVPAPGYIKDGHRGGPVAKAPFTYSQLKKAIPPNCFQRSLLSFSYLFYDLTIVSFLYLLASTFIPTLPLALRLVAWPLYWATQGCVLVDVMVITHKCGHHAFSEYPWLDNTVGLVIHSAFLVAYFSWKYSYRRHHSTNNNIEQDEVFVPKPNHGSPSTSATRHAAPTNLPLLSPSAGRCT